MQTNEWKGKIKRYHLFVIKGCVNVVEVDFKNNQINLVREENNEPPKSFSYDKVFGADSPQSLIY